MTLALENQIEDLQKEIWGLQQMLGQVLLAVGEPVEVSAEVLNRHLPNGARVVIDNHIEADTFVFYVEVPDADAE